MNAPLEPAPAASRRVGWLLLLCLFAAFAAGVAHYSKELPERVATHFGAHGKPNGWMDRVQYRNFTLAIGIGTPLFVLGTFALVERLKGWGLNIPNKDYWLEAERRQATYDFLRRQGLWLAVLLVVFHGVLFHQIVLANARAPVVLPTAHFLAATGGFLAAIGVWTAILLRRFRRPAE